MSLPSSRPVSPAATAAADPPDEPPGCASRSQGLFVVPKTGLWSASPGVGGQVGLAEDDRPSRRSRATASASLAGTYPARSGAPAVVRIPAVSSESLMVIGRPCSAPVACPRAVARSAASAAARARSTSSVTTAFSAGFRTSMRCR